MYTVKVKHAMGFELVEGFETYISALRFASEVAERRMGSVEILKGAQNAN